MRHLLEFFAVSSAGLFISTVGFGWAWVMARGRAIRAEALLEGSRQAQTQQQPLGLAGAVESMAVEIERIGESQRFLTKVLTERTERVIPRQIGQTTPH